MTKAYDNSILARNINVSGVNTNVSGVLQVNGVNVSVSGHNHTSSDITDFNTSVISSIPINVINSTNLYLWSSFR
jgi:hypothetical protein